MINIYIEVTDTSQAVATSNESTANNAALVALTLPATANIGDEVTVNIKGVGDWIITQNASRLIK
jgi:hypothetical protein